MTEQRNMLKRTVLSGTYAGFFMSAAIGLIGKATIGSAAKPLNAISHILWGHSAGHQENWSIRYTGSGLTLNQLACLFWAGCYEPMTHERRPPGLSSALAVSALAYLTDYHLVPRRFTPGFELVFRRREFPWLYLALAASLIAGVHMRRLGSNKHQRIR